jgi:hypothetical protein
VRRVSEAAKQLATTLAREDLHVVPALDPSGRTAAELVA